MDKSIQSQNHLLASLPSADFKLFRPHLKQIELVHEKVLFEAGDKLTHIYFPHSGVVSLVVELADGQMVEAAMIGRDSLVGGSSALDGKIALNKGIVQLPGIASVLAVDRLSKAADVSVSLRTILIRHEQILLVQAQQSAACNASHAVEARLACWLLRSRDLAGDDILEFTQEFLAQMLGVRRTSVTSVAITLQNAGLIKYRRGKVQITDLEGLRETACECYEMVKAQYDRLLNGH